MNYKEYIKSKEWFDLKIDLISIRGSKCEKCGKRKYATGLHVHHLTYERLFNELAEDLLILCPQCHMKEHGLIKERKKKYVKSNKSSGQKAVDKVKSKKYKSKDAKLHALSNAYKKLYRERGYKCT